MAGAETRSPLRTRRREETRARLVRAAGELFDETGTTGAGVNDVCSRAGYTRGAFYSNFASMDELYLAVCDDRARALLDRLEAAIDERITARPGPLDLDHAVSEVVEVLPLDPSWVAARSVFIAQAAARPMAADLLRRHHEDLVDRLGPLGTASLRAARRTSTVPESALAEAMLAAYDGAMLHAVLYPDRAHAFLQSAVRAVLLGSSSASP
ncbi:TetR family transcriptional regulator [Aeromicrobium flavum]|uniref:TetR family transcriptional regulator n=1 Tax=Aeromicrobium flavum TaxID=416568 RepID=A0A512HQI1_9ACTN|nr:TetR/AcrR family transcriptional regulator [Aeromicrobium flavum]GEO87699.1 TetR family transcriptional regulator [Aeromicrobium flavum]